MFISEDTQNRLAHLHANFKNSPDRLAWNPGPRIECTHITGPTGHAEIRALVGNHTTQELLRPTFDTVFYTPLPLVITHIPGWQLYAFTSDAERGIRYVHLTHEHPIYHPQYNMYVFGYEFYGKS
jgi:hypothetical protein